MKQFTSLFLLLLPLFCQSFAPPTTATTTTTPTAKTRLSATTASTSNNNAVDMANVGFVLLAGGKGSRMKADMPKQFMTLQGKPVVQHSLDLFLEALPQFLKSNGKSPPSCVVLVMDPLYQPDYSWLLEKYPDTFRFANPGVERQGSVENGLAQLAKLSSTTTTGSEDVYAAIHDSARPLVTIDEICRVVGDAKTSQSAAVLGVPCKATIKESADGKTVLRTIPRDRLWEVHTPQVVKVSTLQRGFAKVAAEDLEVTDDVSIVEALGEPVTLTLGEYTNLKITTPEDMDVATAILEDRNRSSGSSNSSGMISKILRKLRLKK